MSPQQQQIQADKEVHLAHREREHPITLRVLKAFPPEQAFFKPHESSMSAIETAWMMVQRVEGIGDEIGADEMTMGEPKPAPKAWGDVVAAYERAHDRAMRAIRGLSDDAYHGVIGVPMGGDRVDRIRRGDVLWWFLLAMVHHRGQLSVYLRAVGGKVPSIYGPSADEPWK